MHDHLKYFLENTNRVKWLNFLISMAIGILFLVCTYKYLHLSEILTSIQDGTGAIIRSALMVELYLIGILIVSCGLSGLNPKDIGLRKKCVIQGIVAAIVFFVLYNAISIILSIFLSTTPHVEGNVIQEKASFLFGELILQFFGAAVFEELLMRGFLLVQVAILLRTFTKNATTAFLLSLLLNTLMFTYPHFRGGSFDAIEIERVVALLSAGFFLGLIYLLSRNIFVVIGVHATNNVLQMAGLNGFSYLNHHIYITVTISGFLFTVYFFLTARFKSSGLVI